MDKYPECHDCGWFLTLSEEDYDENGSAFLDCPNCHEPNIVTRKLTIVFETRPPVGYEDIV